MALRLDKFLSDATDYSRKEIKELIKKKRICIGDDIAKAPDIHIEPGCVTVFIDKKAVEYEEGFRYYMLNKPQGVITATHDLKEKTVMELLKGVNTKKLSPVGRLDKDTEGLLLITDDGELNHRLMSPKHHVPKTYYVRVDGCFEQSMEKVFEDGLDIGDDKKTLPAKLEILSDAECRLTIHEGRFHQVKRMMEAVGLKVIFLKRISIGALKLPADLETGEYRKLTKEELLCLQT